MPRKKFEEEPYEPVKEELLQTVGSVGRVEAIHGNVAVAQPPSSSPPTPVGKPERAIAVGQGVRTPSPVVSFRRDDTTPFDRPSVVSQALEEADSESASATDEATQATPALSEEDKPTKRFQVTADEDYELREFIHRLQRRSVSKVSLSTITRATLTIAMRAENELNTEIDKLRPIPQPSNNDPEALARFEERWVLMLANAFRRMRPMW